MLGGGPVNAVTSRGSAPYLWGRFYCSTLGLSAPRLASITYWENWRLVEVAADFYANDSAVSSPLQHLWSMYMQGQVFLLWPVLMSICVLVARQLRVNVRGTVAIAFVALVQQWIQDQERFALADLEVQDQNGQAPLTLVPLTGPGSDSFPGARVLLSEAPQSFSRPPIPSPFAPKEWATYPEQCSAWGGCLLNESEYFAPHALTAELSAIDGAHVIDMTDAYCVDGVCPTIVGNVFVYMDQNHVTTQYSRTVAPFFSQRVLRELELGAVPAVEE